MEFAYQSAVFCVDFLPCFILIRFFFTVTVTAFCVPCRPQGLPKVDSEPHGGTAAELWANDQPKFVKKLMEKIGWEKGTGLGANQDGMVNHITLKHEDNKKVVGFKGPDDNQLAPG